jgi:hypothetical protein
MTGAPWPPADPPAGGSAPTHLPHLNQLRDRDPKWFGAVLAVLDREYPRVAARVWRIAQDETAAQAGRRKGNR